MNLPGKLIAIEGLDGAGSTTQTSRLATWLTRKMGYTAIPTKEPTGGPAGSLVRLALTGRVKFDGKTLAILFIADRMDHQYRLRNGIVTLLQDPKTVIISDRYYLSTFAYQAMEPGVSMEWLEALHAKCIHPALTIFLNVSPEECYKRIGINRGFHFELFEKVPQLQLVRENYFKAIDLLREHGENIHVVDGNGTPNQVESRIRVRVQALLSSGYLSPNEQRLLLDSNKTLAFFWEAVFAAHLQVVQLREIPKGYQIRIADSSDMVIPLNIYNTGTIVVQGPEDNLKRSVLSLAQEVAGKVLGNVVAVSKVDESEPLKGTPLGSLINK